MASYQLKNLLATKPINFFLALICFQTISAQTKIDLTSLNDFKNVGANWHIAGDAYADITKNHVLNYSPGVGVLVNLPDSAAHKDLFTNFKHGDVDIELDCMMAKGSNSGIYLQGRYELQLLDSWGVLNPKSVDMGGLYERNDSKRPEGLRIFDGRAPRQNVSKAPGLWQHFKISFQAPRFVNGVKTENAKLVKVELNGVLIQENIELSGTTAGAISKIEVPEDALRIQGDHGQVAFRNIVISHYNKAVPTITDINITGYIGKFETEPNLLTLKPFLQKTNPIISVSLEGLPKNSYLLQYKGILNIQEEGEYNFNLNLRGGPLKVLINHSILYPFSKDGGKAKMLLPKGPLPIEFIYSKYMASQQPVLILKVNGPGFRETTISDPRTTPIVSKDPVLMFAKENMVLRSFMDVSATKRIVHAVNVGSPEKINYTYDLDNGMIAQVWRGDFLDASPMWIDRGDGSSKPLGAITLLGNPTLAINKLANTNSAWNSDTTNTNFKTKGYVLDEQDLPSFKYSIYGTSVTDMCRLLENRQGIQRTISLKNTTDNLYMQLAVADKIEEISTGLYLIGDLAYYIKIDNAGSAKAIVREQKGQKELLLPIQNQLIYSILF